MEDTALVTVEEYQHWGRCADGHLVFAGTSLETDPNIILTQWLDWRRNTPHKGGPLKTIKAIRAHLAQMIKEHGEIHVNVEDIPVAVRRRLPVPPDYCI